MILVGQALVAALSILQGPGAQSGPLTLDDAIALAARNAFSIQLQASNVEKSRQQVAQAQAGLGPKVTISGTYTRYGKEATANFGGNTITTQAIDSKVVTAQVSLPIDISGNLKRNVNAAKTNELAVKDTLQATMNDVRLNTRAAYFTVLRNEGLVKVAEQALADAQERLKQGQQLFDQQQIAKVDVNRYETQVAQANSDLIAAKNTLQIAQNAFNFTIARPIDTPVQLTDVQTLPETPANNAELVDIGQRQRPEVQSLEHTVKALSFSRRALEAGLNPSLTAAIQQTRNIDAVGFSSQSQTTYGTLLLSLPVFDSGLTRARVREAQQNELQATINLDQTKLSISQEVRNAITNLQGALARLKNAEAQVALAAEVYRLAKVKQDAGAGTYVEVIDAETTLTQARNQQVTARYDYLTAYAQLQRAVGSDGLVMNAMPGGMK
ncbi:alkaline protease secretion protein AprF [soil metagenome]